MDGSKDSALRLEYQGCFLGTMFSCAGEWNIRGVSWELCSVV